MMIWKSRSRTHFFHCPVYGRCASFLKRYGSLTEWEVLCLMCSNVVPSLNRSERCVSVLTRHYDSRNLEVVTEGMP